MSAGSRQSHSKSRNGCGQCKKRRVRCNLQGPVCSNCRRRREKCDYLALGLPEPSIDLAGKVSGDLRIEHVSAKSFWNPKPQAWAEGSTRSYPFTVSPLSADGPITLRNRILQRAPASLSDTSRIDQDLGIEQLSWWKQELSDHVSRFDYLKPMVTSLSALYRRPACPQVSSEEVYITAVQKNIEASKLFRRSGPEVNAANWQAVLFFGIGTTIFQLAASQAATDDEFNFLELFYVLRQNSKLIAQVEPYLRNSALGAFIKFRQGMFSFRFFDDAQSLAAIQKLENMSYTNPISDESRQVCSLAIGALKEWNKMVKGYPKNWEEFIGFPSMASDEFSELLNERHPVSLLIYIHWCAIMHRAPNRWFLNGWARRAATAAALHLGPQWDEFLEWPRTVLATELKAYSSEEMMGVAVILHVADDRVSC